MNESTGPIDGKPQGQSQSNAETHTSQAFIIGSPQMMLVVAAGHEANDLSVRINQVVDDRETI